MIDMGRHRTVRLLRQRIDRSDRKRRSLFEPVLTIDSQSNEIPTVRAELFQNDVKNHSQVERHAATASDAVNFLLSADRKMH